MITTVETKPKSFWRYHLEMVTRPRRNVETLLLDPRRLSLSFRAVGQVAALYTLAMLFIYLGDGVSLIPPWLAIPEDELFLWETFFVGAVTFGCWLLASAVVHLISRASGGHGLFEDTLCALAFAIAVPTYVSGVPDLISGLVRALGWVNGEAWAEAISHPGPEWAILWTYMILYLAGLLYLFPRAVAGAHKMRPLPSTLIGVTGVIVYQGVYFIFIR